MEQKQEIAIKTEHLGVTYDLGQPSETKALYDINIAIDKEDFAVVFGPSGCGKSTLLYAISGIEKPTSGKIWVLDKDITQFTSLEAAKFHRLQISMVFQAYNLIPTLSVLDNVALPQIFRGVSRKIKYLRAKILLERFGILPQANRLPMELSGGQQQRVGIARALINEQPVIFADEPVGNLDSKSAKIVLDILYDLNIKDKKTIILVTHDPTLLKYATHIIYMKDGIVVGEKKFTKEQRDQLVASQMEQPFVSSPSGVGARMFIPGPDTVETAPTPTELSIAEQKRRREEEAQKLVETITAPAEKEKGGEEQKELTIGDLIKEKYRRKNNNQQIP